MSPGRDRLVVHADRPLAQRLEALAAARMVFFSGLPGTGKSLLVHQLAHLAAQVGRRVHLLQWDVARPAFEASPAGQRYPLAGGVTHALIRKAAGLWARRAIAAWNEHHADPRHLLVGETPFIGGRFVELAQRQDDAAESVLAAPSCRFAVAVPSVDVRRFLEAERERRAARPLHAREREDAPPSVLRDLWRELAEVGVRMGIAAPGETGPTAQGLDWKGTAGGLTPYDPVLYRRVYEAVLRHRHVDVVALHAILPTGALSVYDFAVAPPDLAPTPAEAEHEIREVEQRYPSLAAVERDVASWWSVDRVSAL